VCQQGIYVKSRVRISTVLQDIVSCFEIIKLKVKLLYAFF